jgi:hypothetical protein
MAIALRIKAPLVALVVALLVPMGARAQDGITLRGLVDLCVNGDRDKAWLNTNNTGDGNFDPLRARLFVDGRRDNTQIFLQFLYSQQSYSPIRLYGAYLQHKVFDKVLTLEGGLVPNHAGTWAPYTYSNQNPLVAIPLSYYWKSNLPSRSMPNDLDDLLAHRGQGQTGISYADSNGVRGKNYATMPILYDNCWNYGLFAMGTAGRLQYLLGATTNPPGGALNQPDLNENIALQGRFGFTLAQSFTLWLSGAHGAYLSRDVKSYLPAGKTVNDYDQSVLGASAEWKWRHLDLWGEMVFNHFDTPLRSEGLSSQAWWLQAVYTVFPQWEVALRYDDLRHEKVRDSGGIEMSWDMDVYRWEGGIQYRATRELRIKAVFQQTELLDGFGGEQVETLTAGQVSFAF